MRVESYIPDCKLLYIDVSLMTLPECLLSLYLYDPG